MAITQTTQPVNHPKGNNMAKIVPVPNNNTDQFGFITNAATRV